MRLEIFFVLHLAWLSNGVVINGNWSPWSNLETPCYDKNDHTKLILCGGGIRKKYRSCTNPTPQGGGAACVGPHEMMFDCNTHPCQLPEAFLWSEWSECSKNCGRGVRKRFAMCGSIRQRKAMNGTVEPDMAEYELEYNSKCVANQYNETSEPCNTYDRTLCGDPCIGVQCPAFGKCIDRSNETDPVYECECQLGTVMKDDQSACIAPPPTTPTPRPYPTMPPAQKTASTAITRGASTIIIIFLSITLGIFLCLRIFDTHRVIHMNEEIALLLAHICLLPTAHESPEACRILSICIHFFFVACFCFMLLEAIHLYSLVAFVVHRDGILSRAQNVLIGWGMAFVIVLFNMCFEYDNYGGPYHCWVQMDTDLIYGQYIPIITMTIVTFAIIEAAGNSDDYEPLEGQNQTDRTTAKIMQRTLFMILPCIFASFVLGSLAEYEQNIGLYSAFTIINGVIGGIVFFFHCTCNEKVRDMFKRLKNKMCGGDKPDSEAQK